MTYAYLGFFVCVLLSQAGAPAVEAQARIFGLTVIEWGVLLGALGTFVEAMRQRRGRLYEKSENVTNSQKVRALREVFAETMEAHPEIRKTGRAKVSHKATKMGVSLADLQALLESKDDSAEDEAKPAVDPEKEKEK